MVKGGYVTIDLGDTNMTVGGSAITVPGVFSAVSNAYRKMTVLSRVQIGSVKYPDFPVLFIPSGDDYKANINVAWTDSTSAVALVMTITDDDEVTVASATVLSAA